MNDEEITNLFNNRYQNEGFEGCIDLLEELIDEPYGNVYRYDDGLVQFTTGGWSDNESLIHSIVGVLTNIFSWKHYIGWTVGGSYWFVKEKMGIYVLIEKEKKDNYDKLRAFIQNKIDENEEMYNNAVKSGMPTGGIVGELDLLEEINQEIMRLDDG